MNREDLFIEGDPAELEAIYRLVQAELGDEADPELSTMVVPDERLEPLVVGIIIALGGPAVVKGIVSIVKRVMDGQDAKLRADIEARQQELEHEYRMRRLEVKRELRLSLIDAKDVSRPVTIKALEESV